MHFFGPPEQQEKDGADDDDKKSEEELKGKYWGITNGWDLKTCHHLSIKTGKPVIVVIVLLFQNIMSVDQLAPLGCRRC